MNKLSLFSGIGGDDIASEQAGISTVCFVERDPFCQKVLNKHWPEIPIIGDIHDCTKEKIKGTVDIIGGGFPCQPFSNAGNRRGQEDDRYLWPEMLRLVQEFKPAWVVGENVAGIINLGLDTVLSDLENEHYRTQAFIIPACAISAPHRRDRVFMVAHLQSLDEQSGNQKETDWELQGCGEYRGCFEQSWLQVAPTLCRVDDGFPTRLDKDRLHALGNACMPQQIYPIYKAIVEIDSLNILTIREQVV